MDAIIAEDMKKCILVIEDELDFSELLKFHLRDSGCKILCTPNGNEALTQAQKHPPDLILMDLLLPDFDGLTLCEVFRRQPSTSSTPIIMITALSSNVTRYCAKAAGACEFLAKPLDFDALKRRVEALLTTPADHSEADASRV